MNDVFKNMGITVGQPSLIQTVDPQEVKKSDEAVGAQVIRKGMNVTPREILEGQLSKGFSIGLPVTTIDSVPVDTVERTEIEGKKKEPNLKNTHGEEFHSDNDKKVEEHQTTVEEIETKSLGARCHDLQKSLFRTMGLVASAKAEEFKPTKAMLLNSLGWKVKELQDLKNASWLIQEEVPGAKDMAEKLFTKIKKDITDIVAQYATAKSMPKADLVKAAPKPAPKSGEPGYTDHFTKKVNEKLEAKVEKSLTEEELVLKALDDKIIETVPEKPVKDMDKLHENSGGIGRGKADEKSKSKANKMLTEYAAKSELDDLVDLIKGEDRFNEKKKDYSEKLKKLHARRPDLAEKAEVKGNKVEMPKKEFVEEHKDLVDTLESPSHKDDKKEAKEQKQELDAIADEVAKKSQDIVKVGNAWTTKHPPSAPSAQKAMQKNKFIKSIGKGGIVMDFGPRTGNPIADNATALLNQMGDPVQMQIANYQRNGYEKALTSFVQKGESERRADNEAGWDEQLSKPMDQQVKEAFEKGAFDEKAPSAKNEFNKSTAVVAGDKVQATSETDAAVLEMFKAEQAALSKTDGGGFVADATVGGKIAVTAGEPLPELPQN